ncbi:MAG TPA: hypothetical protein VMW93_03595, partial [bacterium]|nr:hypothetical protein [bacterium]
MKTLRRIALPALLVAAIIIAALIGRRLFIGGEGPARASFGPRAEVPPSGWAVAPEERTSSAVEKLNPLHRPTKADA